MPLHLLGKKAWNVYNSDNVERVRRDEAEAQAREQAEEQRMQEADAARRIAILRGEEPPSIDSPTRPPGSPSAAERPEPGRGGPRKRRRVKGEDDTDRDIRYAREDAEAGEKARRLLLKGKDGSDAPLVDHAGHVQLIPAPDEKEIRRAEKNAEAEAEKAKKRKRDEDQYTMRFSNAAGFNNGMAKPWYAAKASPESTPQAGSDAKSTALILPLVQEKDAWGNEDPRRKERERSRISSNDPFAAMQQAQRQLKQSARDKDKWQKERDVELEQLRRAEERKRRHRHHREDDRDSLEDFSLDAVGTGDRGEKARHRHHHRHRRHRSRSRSRSRDRHRRSTHRSNEG